MNGADQVILMAGAFALLGSFVVYAWAWRMTRRHRQNSKTLSSTGRQEEVR
jgi:hypothetical protein